MAQQFARLEEELRRLQKEPYSYSILVKIYDLLEYTDKEIDKIVYHVGIPLHEVQRNAMLESHCQLMRIRDRIKRCFDDYTDKLRVHNLVLDGGCIKDTCLDKLTGDNLV